MRDCNKGFVEVSYITGRKVNRGAAYGLEIPCIYRLYGPKPYTDRIQDIVTTLQRKFSNSAYKTPPLVRYRRCASIGKCRSVRETCPLSGIRSCPLFGSCKCIASTGIAVGTATVVRYSGDVRYWECPLSEVPLYTRNALFFAPIFQMCFPTSNPLWSVYANNNM